MRRRQVLAAGALTLSVSVAGCNDTPPPPDGQFDRPDDRWPTVGYDPSNTANPPDGPRDATEKWATTRAIRILRSGTLSAPVVADGTVYVATLAREYDDPDGDTNHLNAFDADTGERTWTTEFPRLLTGGPALVGSTVVVGGRDGRLHAVRDGNVVWTADLGERVGTPTVYGGRLYVPDGTGRLYAVDRDGRRLWTVDRPSIVEKLIGDDEPVDAGVPAADESGVYATFEAFRDDRDVAFLVAYDHAGNRRWRYRLDGPEARVPHGPAIAGGTVYATAGGTVHAIEAASGDRRWRFVTGYGTAGPPSTDGDRVYVGAKNLYALDAATGTERWRVVNEAITELADPRRLPYLARPPVANGAVYLRAGAVDAADGSRLWGDDADSWLAEGDPHEDPYLRRPMARLAVTADALYLSHAGRGVMKFA